VKWLRLVQILATSSGQYEKVRPGNQGDTVSRLPLGVVPVEEDGSVYCEAPVNRGIYFQLLNEDGLAVHSMRSLTYVHPGEQLTCVGCHEPYDKAPQVPATVSLALRRGPSKIQPEFPEGVVPPDFQEQIGPIFARTCIACHAKENEGPRTIDEIQQHLAGRHERKPDGSKGKRDTPWVRWGWTANSGRGFSRTTPGYCGALGSRLWEHMEEHRNAYTAEDRKRLAWWMDLSCPLQGGYNDYYREVNGVRWPIHQDVDPSNPLGIERLEDLHSKPYRTLRSWTPSHTPRIRRPETSRSD
jgi:cytochrome c553